MSEADKRSLKVKAGVVKRLAKELQMYEAEVAAEGAKAQRLRDAGADPHDIKYQVGGRWQQVGAGRPHGRPFVMPGAPTGSADARACVA